MDSSLPEVFAVLQNLRELTTRVSSSSLPSLPGESFQGFL